MDIMIGIDPHKSSHTAVVIDNQGEVLDQLRIAADLRHLARGAVASLAGPHHRIVTVVVGDDGQVAGVPCDRRSRPRPSGRGHRAGSRRAVR
jgi:hypothetical protein